MAGGFSLLEILVVLVIAGVLAGALVIAAGSSGPRELENAARRAQSLVQLACERAVIGGRDVGFAVVEDGLRFGYFETDGWKEVDMAAHEELRARALGEGLSLAAERDGEALELADEAPERPPFACLSSGELTPFTLRLSRVGVQGAWQVQGHLDGRIDLEPPADAR